MNLTTIKSRLAAITQGEWKVISTADKSPYTKNWREIAPVIGAAEYTTNRWGEPETVCGVRIKEVDADFIASAPQTIRELVEEVEALRAVCAEIDRRFPVADATCAEAGITFTEAVRRHLADASTPARTPPPV